MPARGETVPLPDNRRRAIEERILAAFCGLVCWTAAERALSVPDLDMACHLALAVGHPFGLMRRLGAERLRRLLGGYREREPDFFDPAGFEEHLERWTARPVPRVSRRDTSVGEAVVAVLTIRRPEVLGALDEDLFAELEAGFRELETEAGVAAVVLTGFGIKAFVSGADVRMLAAIRSAEAGERLSRRSHLVLDRIAAFPKPVVCALNGMAVGGGNELAMACHARIARAGLPLLVMQPEPNLGILPGAGATQRLPRLIGLAPAWEILRSARPVSADEALRLGLVSELVPGGELRGRAARIAAAAASGERPLPGIETGPIPVPELPEVEIGHRSRAVDRLIREAVLEGARLDLAAGLRLESRLFGRVCALEDMRIGTRNFVEHGPRSPAPFVHR